MLLIFLEHIKQQTIIVSKQTNTVIINRFSFSFFNFGITQIMKQSVRKLITSGFYSSHCTLQWRNRISRNCFSKLSTFVIKASSKKNFNNLYKNYKAKRNAYLLWDLRILLVFIFLRTCQAADDNCDERQQTMKEKRERKKNESPLVDTWY